MIPRLLFPLVLFAFTCLAGGCSISQDITRTLTGSPQVNLEPTDNISAATLRAFEFEDSKAACQASSECILMRVGKCENVRAVHLSQVDLANQYTEFVKKRDPFVVCAPNLPIEEYEPLCLNRQCLEVTRSSRLLLEVPEQPVAGIPFWIGMSFRLPVDAAEVEAHFLLPETVQVIQGQTTWRGPVRALQDHVLWVKVQTYQTGKIYFNSWAGIKDGNPSISPLAWGKYFTVMSARSLTPQPEAERLVPTPTPTK